ncbi:hypothetical protein [Streptomyces sp. NPDC090798]|uniref:hypothetical protein n=1 Tax=Streptomyces sp. NPDC090798 TaxID=3365968 RepID=UPI00380F5DC1
MSVEIELLGGPADGRRIAIQGDPLDPPLTHKVFQAVHSGNVWTTGRQDQSSSAGMTLHLYRREVNRGDDGALWLYRHDPSAGPVRPGEEPTT